MTLNILAVFLIVLRFHTASPLSPDSSKNFLGPLVRVISQNPISQTVANTYSFFYWLPRRNIPYDSPWTLFKNDTAQFIAWYYMVYLVSMIYLLLTGSFCYRYQIPHNLPPYRYLGKSVPQNFFCFGLPGNTLPLGNWDPWFLSQVCPKVVRKYRESEIKHGRLAMLACVGLMTQELVHPMIPNIGGLAITHMDQLYHLDTSNYLGILSNKSRYKELSLQIPSDLVLICVGVTLPSLNYMLVILSLVGGEIYALQRNWIRWKRNEYSHQFDNNIGIGNLKDVRINYYSLISPLNIEILSGISMRKLRI